MKKYLLTLIVCFIGYSNVFAQNAYYDAIYCASLRPGDFEIDGTITLSKGDNAILSEMIEFHKDPFSKKRPDFNRVRTIFSKIKSIQTGAQDKSAIAGLEVLGLLSPIFNLSKMSSAQTDTLLYGLTVYLAEEFRKGYMHTYMNGVKNTIGKSGELRVLFPMTYQKISTFDPIRYKDFGNEMKAVFDDDLGSSLENLMKHIAEPDTKLTYSVLDSTYCSNLREKDIYPYLGLTASMGQKLINGIHPSDVLGFLDEKYYKSDVKNEKKIGETIHLLNILQRNLRDTATRQSNQFSNVWLNFEKLSKLNNQEVSKYFLALVQKEDSVFFEKELKLKGKNSAQYYELYNTLKRDKITPLLSILTKLDELTKLKDKSLLEEKNFEIYLKNVGELVALVETTTNTLKSPKLKNVVAITSNVFQIYNAVRVKNYSNLPVYLGNILSELSGLKRMEKDELIKMMNYEIDIIKDKDFKKSIDKGVKDEIKDEIKSKFLSYVNEYQKDSKMLGDSILIYGKSVKDSLNNKKTKKDSLIVKEIFSSVTLDNLIKHKDLIKENKFINLENLLVKFLSIESSLKNCKIISNSISQYNFQPLITSIDKFSGFSSGIVSAKTSADVSKVISNFAAPPASFISKRQESGVRFTLGAMPGLSFAYEKIDTVGSDGYKANVGLSLPIGLDITTRLCENKKGKRSSIGLFLQVIDLGAMLNYRLQSSANTLPDKVGWSAIFSPGVSISIGLPETPWSIQVGYQRGPELRKITKDGNGALLPSDRFQIRLAYDIPLLRIR